MSDAALSLPRVQRPLLWLALLAASALFLHILSFGWTKALLFLIGLGLGVTLYHAAFGFTGAYRRAMVERDISGVVAQAVMLALAMILFQPVLAAGEVFGKGVVGAVAPVSVSMAFGAFLFGIGMQIGGGCASGTLFTVGGGSPKMAVVLVFFCIGCFWASLDLGWWSSLPGIGEVSLADAFGPWGAVALQIALLAAIVGVLWVLGGRLQRPLWRREVPFWQGMWRGPWPLLWAAVALALLNLATLMTAGHPWSVTWGFTLWAAKAAVLLGWEPTSSAFWTGGYQEASLGRSIFADTISVMNIAIIVGALGAAAAAGRFKPDFRIGPSALFTAMIGGLMMGYGARLAYGCNIGAFFSGVASGSLHGWVWILAAIPGNALGLALKRRLFPTD